MLQADHAPPSPPRRPPVASAADAEKLLADISDATSALEDILDQEAEAVGAGRVSEGLSHADRKAELAATYLQGLEAAKANTVALVRFAPAGLAEVRTAQTRLRSAALRNQAVIETARSVSEGLLRSLSEELARLSRPSVYAQGGRIEPHGKAGPLAVSRRL